MKLIDRLKLAFSSKEDLTRLMRSSITGAGSGSPAYSRIRYETMAKEGYRKNELIHACIQKTANTSSQVRLKVYSDKNEELPDHPLAKLIKQPNPLMGEFDFWSSVIIFLNLAGSAAYEVVRSRAGIPVQLWPLRPDWLKPISTDTAYIDHYEYKVPMHDAIKLDTRDVLRFTDFDPINFFLQGYPRIAVAARVGDIDNSATDFIKMFWEKGGVPMGILKSEVKINEDDVVRIRKRWAQRYGGFQNWFSPAVLDTATSYQRIGLTFDEMGFEKLDARNEVKICEIFDIPAIIVGAKIGLDRSTYSNYKEAREAWWQDSLKPMYEKIDDVITNALLPEFTGVKLAWDFSKVPALKEETDKVYERANGAMATGAITVNEYRAMINLPPVKNGDVRYISVASVEIPTETPKKSMERKTIEEEEFADDHLVSEKKFMKKLEPYFKEQMKRILDEVRKETGVE